MGRGRDVVASSARLLGNNNVASGTFTYMYIPRRAEAEGLQRQRQRQRQGGARSQLQWLPATISNPGRLCKQDQRSGPGRGRGLKCGWRMGWRTLAGLVLQWSVSRRVYLGPAALLRILPRQKVASVRTVGVCSSGCAERREWVSVADVGAPDWTKKDFKTKTIKEK